MRHIWSEARKAYRDHGMLGPAPVQEPTHRSRSGIERAAIKRAIEMGYSYYFPTMGPQMMAQMEPQIRAAVQEKGRRAIR